MNTQLAEPGERSDLPSLDLEGERLVQPQYAGLGLANVPASILDLVSQGRSHVDVPPLSERALPAELTTGVTRVVLLVADGLGYLQLVREIENGNAPVMGQIMRGEYARPSHWATLTSVFPTTTVAALGTLSSGALPVEHGLLAYTLYLEEFKRVGEMIRWGPADRRGTFRDEAFGGADPEAFFGAPTMHERLKAAGVERTFAVNPAHLAGGPLTRMLHAHSEYVGYAATSSITAIVPRLLREVQDPTYIFAYWPTVDTIAHLLGPDADEHNAEIAAFDHALGRLIEALPADGDTLLLATADHGHVATSKEQEIRLNDYPRLLQELAVFPTGERRATYLHARPGAAEDVEAIAREELGDVAAVVSRERAIELGFFGPAPLPAKALSRIGDVILFPRGALQIAYELPLDGVPELERPRPAPPFRGLHGGLSAAETLVPLIAVRV